MQITSIWKEQIQLYLGLVGTSGSKKSPVINTICGPLADWFDQNGRSSKELADGVGHPIEEITTDATPEALVLDMSEHDGRGIILTDEGTILSIMAGTTYGKSGGAQNIDIALQAWNGGLVRCRRKGENADIRIPQANLSILVGLQPNMLNAFARNSYLNARGLPQRFLFFIPQPMGRCILNELPETDLERLEAWGQKITSLAAAFRDAPLTLPLNISASNLFKDYCQVMEDRRTVDWCESEALEAWASKAVGMTARLAGILTLLKDPSAKQIEHFEMHCARQMMEEYFIPHMYLAFCGEKHLSPAADAVLKAMPATMTRSCKCVLYSVLWDRLRKKKPFCQQDGKDVFEKALSELIAANMIRPARIEPTETGRPIKGACEVHPDILTNVPALQPKRTGTELNRYFPVYESSTTPPEAHFVCEEVDTSMLPF